MSEFDITAPAEGGVMLSLSWDDAEILTRLVGMTNSGNLIHHSPALADFVENMVEHVGRNDVGEARRYKAETKLNGQTYITDYKE